MPEADRTRVLVCPTARDPVFWSRSFSVDAPAAGTFLSLGGRGPHVWKVWSEDRSCRPYESSESRSCSFDVLL